MILKTKTLVLKEKYFQIKKIQYFNILKFPIFWRIPLQKCIFFYFRTFLALLFYFEEKNLHFFSKKKMPLYNVFG